MLTCPGSEDMIIADKAGHIVYSDTDGEGPELRLEIDRNQLTNPLLSSIPKDRIYWNNKVLSVAPGYRNSRHIICDRGKLLKNFDLVVGADGGWSRARLVLTYRCKTILVMFTL
jgi:2-polyprenyl-6-methoxyphenol hydroxylase-like FAD-dependent oxidoreductase